MSGFVKGIGALFGGGSSGADAEAAQEQQQLSAIAQQRAAQAAQDNAASTNAALAGAGPAPRGQRLLVSANDGGLAKTLGGSA